jgi:membrane protease YdiL (CAAX protease family)
LLAPRRLRNESPVEFILYHLVDFAVLTTIALLWGRWSKLDLGFSAPAWRKAEPWILLFILWCTAEWALSNFLPVYVDPEWLEQWKQLSLGEDLIISVLLAPVCEELFFRGAMFASFLRRWGIWTAALVPSLIWGLIHVQYEWWVVAAIAGSGMLLAMVRWKGGSIYLPIGLHAAWNLLVVLNDRGLFGSGTSFWDLMSAMAQQLGQFGGGLTVQGVRKG